MECPLFFVLLLFIIVNQNICSQEDSKTKSIRTGIGLGFNDGKRETGMGLIYSIGYQKSYGQGIG